MPVGCIGGRGEMGEGNAADEPLLGKKEGMLCSALGEVAGSVRIKRKKDGKGEKVSVD